MSIELHEYQRHAYKGRPMAIIWQLTARLTQIANVTGRAIVVLGPRAGESVLSPAFREVVVTGCEDLPGPIKIYNCTRVPWSHLPDLA